MPDQRHVPGGVSGKKKGLLTKSDADALYLALLGGTMQGDINMDGFDIDEVTNITSSGSISTTATGANNNTGDVTTLTSTSGDINLSAAGDINANTNKITNVVDPTAAQDAATKSYSDAQDVVIANAAVAYTDAEIVTHAADADAHHAELHTVASHSDTSATGSELDTLTDGSDASSLHTHDTEYLDAFRRQDAETWLEQDAALHVASCEFETNQANDMTPWRSTLTNSGTIANATGTNADHRHHPGLIEINSSASANSGGRIRTQANNCNIEGMGGSVIRAIVRIETTSNLAFTFGFHNSTNIFHPAHGWYIRIGGTTLEGYTSDNSTRTATSTSYTISTGTWYLLTVALNDAETEASFSVHDMSGTELWSDTENTNLPANTRLFGHGLNTGQTSGGPAAVCLLDWMGVAMKVARV